MQLINYQMSYLLLKIKLLDNFIFNILMEKIKILGQKQNSIVELVKLSDGREAVVKYYPIFSRSMFIEMNIMATSNHQNIIKLVKLISSKNDDFIYMVMEKEEFSLADILQITNLPPIDKIIFLLQIAYGIRHLHVNNIIHLDLTLENIMVTNAVCKIIDFGSAEYIFTDKIQTNQLKCTCTHRAPEGFGPKGFAPKGFGPNPTNIVIDRSFDIWSFGIIMLELYSGTPLYLNNFFPCYQKNSVGLYNYDYDSKVKNILASAEFVKFVKKNLPIGLQACLNSGSAFRPDINQVICILTNMLNDLVGCNPTVFEFDNSIELKSNIIVKCLADKNAVEYCQNICDTISKKYVGYSKHTKWYTCCLIERLFCTLANPNLNKKYIDQAILLCHKFENQNNFLVEDLDTKKKILVDIIMATNGILFHYNKYLLA
jgi:serine/threonine protein kinase